MAIENGVQNAELGYILDPAFQIENLNGKPVVGGYICIYEAGTDNKYISYENFDGAQNPFKIPLKADGRAVILGDPSLTYDVYAYDSYGNQLFSRLNVQCNVPGNISIKGADTRIKNTDGTLDISLQTMGNNVREYTINTRNKELGVQDPLYFVRNDESATIIGFSGDGYLTKDKFEYDDNFNITGYDGSAFASNGQTYSAGTNIDITDNVISVTGLPTSSDVENAISSAVTNVENKFEYNENNYITAYNSSAFAGTNYSAGDYVSIENDTISVTGLQPSGDYATHNDLTAYQPSGDYATHNDLTAYQTVEGMTAYQPSGDYAYASAVSAAITGSQTGALQISGGWGNGLQIDGGASVYVGPGGHINVSNGANLNLNNGGTVNVADSSKINLSSFANISGTSAGITASDWVTSGGIRLSDMTAYQPASGMTAYQPTGDYATHDDLTAYATTSLVSSVSSELYSAFSGISGDFELVAGSGVELVDDPNAKTTTINVTAEGTPVTAIEQMIESATSGKADSAHVIEYRYTPDSDPIYASFGSLNNVNRISGSALDINSGSLIVSSIVTATTAGFEAVGLSAGNGGSFCIKCTPEVFSGGNLTGFTFSSQNTNFGTAKLTTADGNAIVQMRSPKFEAKNVSGAGFSIEASGARGYDHNGNVVWDTSNSPAPNNLVGYADTKASTGGLDGNIILTVVPKSNQGSLSSTPYTVINGDGFKLSYGASAPSASLSPSQMRFDYNSAHMTTDYNDVKVLTYTAYNDPNKIEWSLTGSVQKREIECDSATSAITSIAGSAIGGGVSQSAFDELKQSYDALSSLFATYSGQWLLPNEGEE